MTKFNINFIHIHTFFFRFRRTKGRRFQTFTVNVLIWRSDQWLKTRRKMSNASFCALKMQIGVESVCSLPVYSSLSGSGDRGVWWGSVWGTVCVHPATGSRGPVEMTRAQLATGLRQSLKSRVGYFSEPGGGFFCSLMICFSVFAVDWEPISEITSLTTHHLSM